MKDVTYIDCYASVGRRGPKDEQAFWRTETLIEEMEFCEIQGALITHAISREYDPLYGNKVLIQELKKSDRLIGCWSAMPHHCGDFPKPKEFIRMMKDNNIRCAAMYPKNHLYNFNLMQCGELLSEFTQNEIPVLIPCGMWENYVQTNLKEVDEICTAFPELKLILLGIRWEQPRQLIPMMQKHKNIYFEFSNFQVNRGIEWFTDLFGNERFLFGTDFPEKSPGAAKSYLDYSEISMETRKKIAGQNIAKLLKLAKVPSHFNSTKHDDEVLKLVKEGKPLDNILVIDSHAHMSHEGGNGVGYMPQKQSHISGIINRNKLMGIDKICISSWLAIGVDYEEGNKIVLDAIKQFPDQVIGYAALDPNYITDWDEEIRRVHEEYKFKGLKPYKPKTMTPYNSPKYNKWYQYANERNLFCLNHPVDNFKNEMLDAAGKYQNMSFLLAHSGWCWRAAREHVEIAKERSNTFLEITYTAVTYGSIEYMVKEVGAEKVLFGTDQPMRDPIPQFGWVAYSHLTGEEKKKILGLNMQKIIDRCKI
jgi:predicted TIM-barrel fold metal-dependent hydrolase